MFFHDFSRVLIDAPDGVALYCVAGPRERKGEAALLESGYERALYNEEGPAAWKQAGLPVEVTQ